MVLKVLAKIATRENRQLVQYRKGDCIEISEAEGQRLIHLGVAECVQHQAQVIQDEAQDFDDQEDTVAYLDTEALEKMKKQELVEYAASIGLNLDLGLKHPELVAQIIDYIEEVEDGQI